MPSDPAAKGPRRSTRIGKYEVLAHIATGGMGAVYKARDVENGRPVALKVMSPELAAKPSMIERFRREAQHAAKLCHENVVTLYEFGEAKHTFFLAMEFIDGIDLYQYIKGKGPLDPDEALQIIVQGCRALDHAFQRGIIHRDIKPSNFLVTRQDDRLVIKMTDLGLARQVSNDEFRVTRAGTTVGTLDYMAPEQARDSGLADIRSDLYSLGSTWYHLLAGHPTFPKGGLGERLNRILNEEPPDVRRFNACVSKPMASILNRLLAKEPAERYQTPAELLSDLESLSRGEPLFKPLELLENLARAEGETVAPSSSIKKVRRSSQGRRTPRPMRSASATGVLPAGGSSGPERQDGSRFWYGLAGAAAVLLVVGLIVFFSWRRSHKENLHAQDTPPTVSPSEPATPIVSPGPSLIRNPDPDKKPDDPTPIVTPPKKPNWPALYSPTKAIDVAALLKEIEAPWATPAALGPTVELVVGRLPADKSGKTFRSLAAACQAIPVGATGILELRDNGPFFDIPAAVADRNLVIRAAKGYRPLLVWDVQRTLDERRRDRGQPASPLIFLHVKHGNLTLQDVHLALQWPEAPSEGAALLQVEDGDLTVSNCTFSLAGKPRDGVTLARSTATGAATNRCRFSRCHARGARLSMLDLNAPGAQVLFDNCLLVGGDFPLVQVRAGTDRVTKLRAARSTMIGDKNLLTLRPAITTDRDPAFDWLGWDVLLSRKTREGGGELLRLTDSIGTRQISWRAVNGLYAGWETLLAGPSSIPATDLSAWRRLWGRFEGEAVQGEPWPTAVVLEPAEMPARTYGTADSAVAFAASTGNDQLLGCDLAALPAARDNWLPMTFGRFAIVAPAVPEDTGPPEIPAPGDNLYHGERLDLNRTDLGAYLQLVQKTRRLAPRVVLHLSGSGERFTTPIRIKGSSLVLYFEPPPANAKREIGDGRSANREIGVPSPPTEKAEPLALLPAERGSTEALLEIEQGSLDIINGRLRFSDAAEGRVLPWLIKVAGGDVRLFRTRLEVRPTSSDAYRGLIAFNGSGDPSAEKVHVCAINESILVSGRTGIRIQGIGARLSLTQTLLIAGADAIRPALDANFTGKANLQCLLDRATVAARGSVVHLPELKQTEPPTEPMILQTHDCAFLNLFVGRKDRAGLIRYDDEALARGLLVWQSDNDAFDRRLWFAAAAAAGPLPDKREEHSSWLALWGTPCLRRAQLNLSLNRTLDTAERWPLDRLADMKIQGGADLEKLGIARKIVKKSPR